MIPTLATKCPFDDTRSRLYQLADAAREACGRAAAHASVGHFSDFGSELGCAAALVQAASLALHASGMLEERTHARLSLIEDSRKAEAA